MQCQDDIVFNITPDALSSSSTSENSNNLFYALCKVVDKEKASQVVTKGVALAESDLEVIDLELSEQEYQLLVNQRSECFSKDAMTSLKVNYET